MRISAPISALVLTSTLIGCSPPPATNDTGHTYDLSELFLFQSDQVSTDLISMPERIGLDRAVYGWWPEDEPSENESCLRLAKPTGRFEIFSADGDVEAVEIELRADPPAPSRPKVRFAFNGQRIGHLPPPTEWTRLELEAPKDRVRRGMNYLEVTLRQPKRNPEAAVARRVCVRRVRVHSATGRALWPRRPTAVTSTQIDSEAPRTEAVAIPVAGFVDAVFTVPPAANLRGRYRLDSRPSSDPRPLYLYAQTLDSSGAERTLLHRRLYTPSSKATDIDLALDEWRGQRLRLRLGVTGPGNGVVHWQDLRIVADEPVDELVSLPPIAPEVPAASGELGRPDVLIVLLDAARADGFSVFGGPYPTPAIDRLAGDGTAFTNAVAPAPWTGQSVPAILSGFYPDTLGVGPWGSRLPDEVSTAAEILSAAGYRTVLWSQHPFYTNHDSFRRGFDEYFRGPKGAYEVLPERRHLLAEDRPTFAFVHLLPPHTPYNPPAPFRGAYSSWYEGDISVEAKFLNSFPRRRDPTDLSEEDRRYVLDRYLENVAFADDLIARLLAKLDAAKRYDDSLIIVLSDHGEAFLEHGRYLHTATVHREMLHVPLVFKWPRSTLGSGGRVSEPVSLVDVVPTLVDGLGLDGGSVGFQGRSLLPAAREGRSAPDRPLYAVTRGLHDADRPPSTQLMLEISGWRALVDVDRELPLLYDVIADPLESRNLAFGQPLRALELRQAALAQWHSNRRWLGADHAPEIADELDPEMEEELRALGYLD